MERNCFDFHTHQIIENALCDVGEIEQLPAGEKLQFSVGIHPWKIFDEASLAKRYEHLLELTEDERVTAIGEIGLDLLHEPCASLDIQIKWFKKQAQLAEEIEVPVIIHSVRQHDQIRLIRKMGKYKQPWILHGYCESLVFAQQLKKEGILISLGERFLNSKYAQTLFDFPDLPFFIETDDSKILIAQMYEKINDLLHVKNGRENG